MKKNNLCNPSFLRTHLYADPILYDALIRRFQTPAEREQEGRAKGYSRMLEVDLLRGEARLAQLAAGPAAAAAGEASPMVVDGAPMSMSVSVPAPAATDQDVFIREYADGAMNGTAATAEKEKEKEEEEEEGSRTGTTRQQQRQRLQKQQKGSGPGPGPGPETRAEGRERWEDFLRRRFVLGRDDDFDYRPVDENDEYDALERREEEDRWFNDEVPEWASEGGGGGCGGSAGEVGSRTHGDRRLEGETGVQDF